MKYKNVLITGGGGFMGAALAESLVREGCRVRVLDLRPAPDEPAGEYIQGDVSDSEAVLAAASGMDLAFNLASLLPCSRAGDMFLKVNVGGTDNLVRAAKSEGLSKIVHVSSSIVYGRPAHTPLSETSPAVPIGDYGKSKLDAEKVALEGCGTDIELTIIRPRMIIGPGRLGLLTILFDWIKAGKRVYLIGPGTNRFQMIHLDDMIRACILSMDAGSGQTYNIGCDNVPIVADLIGGLIEHADSNSRVQPIPQWLIRPVLAGLDTFKLTPLNVEHYAIADHDYVLDTSKAKGELGWLPEHGQIDTLCEAYDWYQDNRDRLRAEMASDLPALGILKLVKLFS